MLDFFSVALIAFAVVVLFLLSGIRIAQQYQRGVVFRLGLFTGTRGPGIYYLIPIIEWQRLIDIRTVTVAVEQQETITRDSVTVKVNAVLWFRVTDPAKAVVAVENFNMAIYQVALTGLRNIIGQHDLDEVLKERDKINGLLKTNLNELSSPWGVMVEIVEMKDVEIPENMQRVMAMEAEAIREKRARIIKASAELEASEKLAQAAQRMMDTPASLELRRMQMISEVGADNNSTVVLMIPAEFQALARTLTEKAARENEKAKS
jgi:regulator of protease activity HflC (stomatin/prohibitin superfamily)